MRFSSRPLFDNPADVALFVLRPEAERLEANCRDGINTLLLGAPGMGKTSLLRYVLFQLRESDFPAVGIDASPAETALDVVHLLVAELRRRQTRVRPYFPSLEPANRLGEAGEMVSALRELHFADQEEREPRTAILLDSLPSAKTMHGLFGKLRDELWQLPYTWVVSARADARGVLLTPPADAFFEDVIELQPLSEQQQEELVRRRLGPGEETPWRLAAGGEENPRRLLEVTRESIRSGESPDRQLENLARRESEVDRLGRPASMLYAELRNGGPASASDEDFLRRLGWSRQRAVQVFADLEEAGLVRAEQRPGPSGRPRKVFEIVPVTST